MTKKKMKEKIVKKIYVNNSAVSVLTYYENITPSQEFKISFSIQYHHYNHH